MKELTDKEFLLYWAEVGINQLGEQKDYDRLKRMKQ